jgi:hypothetical protein
VRGRARIHPGTPIQEVIVIVVREIMYCKPGKVRAMVDKFLAMSARGKRLKT